MASALIGQCKGWTIRKVMGGGGALGPQEDFNLKNVYNPTDFAPPPQKKKKINNKDKNKNMHMEDLCR